MGINGVGKSSLVQRLIRADFDPHEESTIGASFYSLTHPTSFIKIDMWDTAGQERYSSLCKLYYRDAEIAIIVIAVNDGKTENDSVNRAKKIIEEIITNSKNIKHFLIVINKLDVDKSNQQYIKLEKKINKYMKHLELDNVITYSIIKTSAKTNFGMDSLKNHIFEIANTYSSECESNKININSKSKKKKWFCC
jgi:Ras-related protein Rab-5C